jgi:hypothetical protein
VKNEEKNDAKKTIKKQKVTKKHGPETTVNHPALVGERVRFIWAYGKRPRVNRHFEGMKKEAF